MPPRRRRPAPRNAAGPGRGERPSPVPRWGGLGAEAFGWGVRLTLGGADVLVLGAGPTGCCLGVYLARRGARVTLVEAVERPEGVVGESMLPCSSRVFEECGLDLAGFQVKHGAVFCRGGEEVRFDFAEAEDPRWTHTWQVQREIFDLRWRALAASAGCRLVHAQATAVDLPTRTLHTTAGPLRADHLVDAGGRQMWLATRLGLREGDASLRNRAVGTRMCGVRQLGADQPGDITISCIPEGWIWIIPFGDGVASVGCVLSPRSPIHGTAEACLAAAITLSPDARRRLSDATRVLPLRGLQDFTASARTFSGDGFALVGDAATFIDPVFSSGVLLGLEGARGLAEALDGGDLAAWEARYRDGAGVFRRVIDAWYGGDFMTLALAPRSLQKPYIRAGIVSLLAGDVFDPGRPAARRMAERMPALAARVRGLAEAVPG